MDIAEATLTGSFVMTCALLRSRAIATSARWVAQPGWRRGGFGLAQAHFNQSAVIVDTLDRVRVEFKRR